MFRKIFISFILILFIGISLTGFLSIEVAKNAYYKNVKENLKKEAHLVSHFVFDEDINLDKMNTTKIQAFLLDNNQRITIIDIRGKVHFDSKEDISIMDNHKDRPEVKKAIQGIESSSTRYSNTLKRDMMYYATPIIQNGLVKAIIRLSIPLEDLNSINRDIFKNIIIGLILGIIFSALIGYRYLYYYTKPIKELTHVAKEMAGGDLSRRITYLPRDEIGELAISFNEMTAQLQNSMEELKIQNIKFETVLDSMKDGVIAVDLYKNIILINPSAKKLFHIQETNDLIGKNILNFIRNSKLYHELDVILSNNTESSIEIQIDYPIKKQLGIYTKPLRYLSKHERVKGIIIVIQDITELRKLENVRKDFVANVSHELKTPITSIKGFVETLRSGRVEDENTKNRFLEIIDFESERMIRLVEDILTLSNIESSNKLQSYKEIKVEETIIETIQMVQQLADHKNISLNTKIGKALPPIYFTKDNFKQILINIIDNSIKYTPNGGDINIEAKERGDYIEIVIKDNGIGIPKEDLPRLFERFYRVDKARSRSAGGTGLGLAIVKHLLHLINGNITVESELNKGTSFKLNIPIKK